MGICAVVVVPCVWNAQLLLTQARDVLLLKAVLGGTLLLLQLPAVLCRQALLLVELNTVLRQPLLLLSDELLLSRLWQTPWRLPRLRLLGLGRARPWRRLRLLGARL